MCREENIPMRSVHYRTLRNAFMQRARVHGITGQQQAAIDDYTEVIDFKMPGHDSTEILVDAYYERGYTYNQMKMYKQAQKDYSKSISLAPHQRPNYLQQQPNSKSSLWAKIKSLLGL